MFRTLLITLAAVPLAVAAPVPKGATPPPLYFPTQTGAKWVYDRGDDEEEVEVSAVEKAGGEWIVSRKRSDGSAAEYLAVTVSADGLTQPRPTSGGDGPVCLLKAAAKAGDSWDVPGGKRTLVGTEEVKVAAGTYTALKVAWDATAGGGRIVQWYAPGVGEVKKARTNADGTETVLRSLKSFTAGK